MNKPKIFVVVRGGMVQEVLTNSPHLARTLVTVIDFDVDGDIPDEVVRINAEPETPANVGYYEPEVATITVSDNPEALEEQR